MLNAQEFGPLAKTIGKNKSNKEDGTRKNRTCFKMKRFKDVIENPTYITKF